MSLKNPIDLNSPITFPCSERKLQRILNFNILHATFCTSHANVLNNLNSVVLAAVKWRNTIRYTHVYISAAIPPSMLLSSVFRIDMLVVFWYVTYCAFYWTDRYCLSFITSLIGVASIDEYQLEQISFLIYTHFEVLAFFNLFYVAQSSHHGVQLSRFCHQY